MSLLVGATVRTYQWRSIKYFRAQRHRIFVAAAVLSPVISVPEIPLSVIMVIADDDAPLLWRIIAASVVFVLSQLWIVTQQSFVPTLGEFTIFGATNGRACFVLGRVVSGMVISWPLLPIIVSLVALGRTDSLKWFFAVLALSRITAVITGKLLMVGHWPSAGCSSPRLNILLKQAIYDMSPFSLPNVAKYGVALLCMFGAIMAACSADLRRWAAYLLVIGAALSMLSIRRMIEMCLRNTMGQAPILRFTTDLHLLCALRCAVGFMIFICLQVLVCLISGAQGGAVRVWLVSLGLLAIPGVWLSLVRALDISRHLDWLSLVLCLVLTEWSSL